MTAQFFALNESASPSPSSAHTRHYYHRPDDLDDGSSRGTQSIIRDSYGEVAVAASDVFRYECLADGIKDMLHGDLVELQGRIGITDYQVDVRQVLPTVQVTGIDGKTHPQGFDCLFEETQGVLPDSQP